MFLMNIEIAGLIVLLVVLFVLSMTLFPIASLNCLLVYLILNDNFSFCGVISAASLFPIKGLHNVKQDFTLNLKINYI